MQFAWLSRDEAVAYLARAGKSAESGGDRIAMQRRAHLDVTTADERAAVRRYNAEHGYDERGRRL